MRISIYLHYTIVIYIFYIRIRFASLSLINQRFKCKILNSLDEIRSITDSPKDKSLVKNISRRVYCAADRNKWSQSFFAPNGKTETATFSACKVRYQSSRPFFNKPTTEFPKAIFRVI